MLSVRVRIYRSHDYDLMAMAYSGMISIATVAKKALEACYLGEDYKAEIRSASPAATSKKFSSTLITRVQLTDDDVPGIEEWFRGFSEGARNNMIKCLIRKAIGDVPVWAYRTDGWVSAVDEEKKVEQLLEKAKKSSASNNVRVVTKEKKVKKKENVHDLKEDEQSKKKEPVREKTIEKNEERQVKENASNLKKEEKEKIEAQEQTREREVQNESAEEPEFDAFDAFGALNSLQNGTY